MDKTKRGNAAVEPNRDLEQASFVLAEIRLPGVQLRARRVVALVPVWNSQQQLLCLTHEPWSLDVFAQTRTELLVEAQNQLLMLWKEYALAADDDLSEPALRVKRQLLQDWEETAHAQG